jgi:NhaP-type Na+/H+ or K+/H+ antiporter
MPGVISVAVFGLYGAATSKWELSAKVEESGAFDAFWDSIAFITNAIVFFYSGVACINFFVRWAFIVLPLASSSNRGGMRSSPLAQIISQHRRRALCFASLCCQCRVIARPSFCLGALVRLALLLAAICMHHVAHRSASQLREEDQLSAFTGTLWRFPLVYLFIFIVRFLLICVFRPLFCLSRQDLSFKEIGFATVAGLRGSVSLILTQAVVVDPGTRDTDAQGVVRSHFLSALVAIRTCRKVLCNQKLPQPTGMQSAPQRN